MSSEQDQVKVAQEEQATPAPKEQEESSKSHDVGELIAESKAYRKRAQTSESKVEKLQAQLKSIEEQQLKDNEDWKVLAEKRETELSELKVHADRGKALEESLRKDALESMSEEDREFAEDLSTEKLLKFAKRSKNVVQTDESIAAKRAQDGRHPYKDMDKKERQGNWQKVLDHYMN
jgi:predicted nuclease with TOPRIM domain